MYGVFATARIAADDNRIGLDVEYGVCRNSLRACDGKCSLKQIGFDAGKGPAAYHDSVDPERMFAASDLFDLINQGLANSKLVHLLLLRMCH